MILLPTHFTVAEAIDSMLPAELAIYRRSVCSFPGIPQSERRVHARAPAEAETNEVI